jgi:polyisoprenoid-binding protein YceI
MSTTITTPIPAGTWAVDPSHSSVEFTVKHMGIATVRGRFREFEGRIEMGEDLASSRAYGKVKAASVDTNEPQRDEHLRSPDFVDVERYRTSPSSRRRLSRSTRPSTTSPAT